MYMCRCVESTRECIIYLFNLKWKMEKVLIFSFVFIFIDATNSLNGQQSIFHTFIYVFLRFCFELLLVNRSVLLWIPVHLFAG